MHVRTFKYDELGGSGGIVPHILNVGAELRRVVSLTTCQFTAR